MGPYFTITIPGTTLVGWPTTWVQILHITILGTTLVGWPTTWVHILNITILGIALVGWPTIWVDTRYTTRYHISGMVAIMVHC